MIKCTTIKIKAEGMVVGRTCEDNQTKMDKSQWWSNDDDDRDEQC